MRRAPFLFALLLCLAVPRVSAGGEEAAIVQPNPDEIDPLLPAEPADFPAAVPEPASPGGFRRLFDDATLTVRTIYYGRSRETYSHPGTDGAAGEIHVNAFGLGLDFRSGYAWNLIGFDLTGQTNLGRGRGNSEVLKYDYATNRDSSSAALGQAALKTKAGDRDLGFEARGGYTPISVGSIGTSGGLHSHAYRGFETKFFLKGAWLGYAWADQFRNDWDDTYRDMTNVWHQNRTGLYGPGQRISYIHTVGGRYEFGPDKAGFVDLGLGEGRRYRRNAQLAVSVPVELENIGVLAFTGYGQVARYQGPLGPMRNLRTNADSRETEYHVSGSASLKAGDWFFLAGLGHTRSPNSGEMQFRLTAWANSDNRNFIQTWGQLDDFVWDGQNVFKASAKYRVGKHFNLPGLSVGASYLNGWNADNPGGSKSRGWELDYFAEYIFEKGRVKGLAIGAYAGHLRYRDNDFYGKTSRNDIKVIVSYSRTLEQFLRR